MSAFFGRAGERSANGGLPAKTAKSPVPRTRVVLLVPFVPPRGRHESRLLTFVGVRYILITTPSEPATDLRPRFADVADAARAHEKVARQEVYDGIVKRAQQSDLKKRVDHKKRSEVTDLAPGQKTNPMSDTYACGIGALICPSSCEFISFDLFGGLLLTCCASLRLRCRHPCLHPRILHSP